MFQGQIQQVTALDVEGAQRPSAAGDAQGQVEAELALAERGGPSSRVRPSGTRWGTTQARGSSSCRTSAGAEIGAGAGAAGGMGVSFLSCDLELMF